MKRKFRMFALGALVLMGALGCSIVDTVLSNTVGGSKGNSIASLWTDVPPLQGAQKLSLDLPVTMQVAIQAMIKASASSSDVQLDKFDWIGYSTTQTPDQIKAYYSMQRMNAAGWNSKDQPGCDVATDSNGISGGFCLFVKGTGTATDRGSVLFIVLAPDDQTKQTQVYYVRLDGVVTKTPVK